MLHKASVKANGPRVGVVDQFANRNRDDELAQQDEAVRPKAKQVSDQSVDRLGLDDQGGDDGLVRVNPARLSRLRC